MPRTSRYSDEDLATAVAQSITVAGVMRALGIKPAGGSHFHIRRRIKRMKLDTSHFLGASFRKGTRQERLPADVILVKRDPSLPRAKPHMLRRALIEIGLDYQCNICAGTDTWIGKPLTLHVDHLDGDYSNCLLANLRFLCPNCHSQTATYCRKISARRERDPA